jgi:DNA-binding transcriptional LysR family regulator
VVGLEQLTALDLYLWFGHGQTVAETLDLSQSTVSRQARAAMRVFGLGCSTGGGHRALIGDQTLLLAERRVHQVARLRGMAPLRLEATYCAGPWFAPYLPPGWLTSRFDMAGMARPLQLLGERVIDAWIGSYQPDLPDPDDPRFWVIDLLRQPVHLLASPSHPLAGERRLSPGDLHRFPSLALPDGWFPRTEALLRAQGLWKDPVTLQRYDPASWEGRCSDEVTLTYGHSLTEALQPGTVRLDWDLGHLTGDALVVHRDLGDEPAIQQLVERLSQGARRIAAGFADVQAA